MTPSVPVRALLLLLLLPALVAAEEGLTLVDFGGRGRINQWYFGDLDGDGPREVILVQGRKPHVYIPTKDGYDLESPSVLDPEPGALYFDVAQVDEDEKTLEIVFVTPRGVVFHRFLAGAFAAEATDLIRVGNLVSTGQRDNLHFRDFLQDLDGDGLPDVVLATRDGFAIFYQERPPPGEAGDRFRKIPDRLIPYRLKGALEVGEPGLLGRIRGTVTIPDFRIEDFTGDGRNDFILDDGQSLSIYAAGEDGRHAVTPTGSLDLTPLAGDDGELPGMKIRDVNGDGKPDILVTRGREGITELYLFGEPLTTPTLRLKLPGWSFEPRLSDLNGDGRPDLVVPTTPEMGISTALSVVVTGAITVMNHIYLNTGDAAAPFGREPDRSREIRVKLRLFVDLTGSIRAVHSVLVEYEGDFIGDSRKDLVYRGDSDELLFFPGVEEGIFAKDPARKIRIPDTEEYQRLETQVIDLNADGRDDLAIFYFSRLRKEDRLVLLISKGE